MPKQSARLTAASRLVEDFLAGNPKKPLLVLLGPTASGKTALAIELAQQYNGEIVSADSRAIYRECEIATAKPTAEELAAAPHHCVSTHSPARTVTVAAYRQQAERAIRAILARGRLPILTGSHTLLISAIVENYRFPGAATSSQRAKLLAEYAQPDGAKQLWQRLKQLDSELAATTDLRNSAHLIRALERAETGSRPTCGRRKYQTLLLGIQTDRESLYQRIDARVDTMLSAGLLAEVQSLTTRYPRYAPALRGHGYREIIDHLHGEKSLETAIAEIKRNTRHYAKRQSTWWRGSALAPDIHWI